ncbi:sigma-70 family RNA polymerase sigma factor [Clostridium sp. 19966]|uniref:hypothetical protein n=1 Tax=Clostridium sp. 19966 TaxID=2768166 RepID=UPI0028DE3697|nr:hypothetical protein [Clostridium sp. 19966]MDT8717620.1 sigma-70 family RNA polymerase sigma factor [Clostridium sp. 19966]
MKEVIEVLKGYRTLKAEIIALELDIEELHDEENLGPEAISYQERTGKTYKFSSSTENQAINLIDKVQKLENEKRKKQREIERIENALSILDENEKDVLEMKHLRGYKWDVITCRLDRSYQQCKRIESKAIRRISKMIVVAN